MRSIIPFNDHWLYAPQELSSSAGDDQFEAVTLPHTNVVLPYHNFDNLDYQFVSTYRKRFTLPEPLAGCRVFVEFDGAMTSAQVSINGRILGDHDGGYVPFSFDLTDHLRDGENVLNVRLDSTERPDVPPNGYMVDYLTFGGIYRDVRLLYVEPVHIKDVFVWTKNLLTDAPELYCDVTVRNLDSRPHEVLVAPNLLNLAPGRLPFSASVISVPANGETTFQAKMSADRLLGNEQTFTFDLAPGEQSQAGLVQRQVEVAPPPPIQLWSLENPTLYTVEVLLLNYDQRVVSPENPANWTIPIDRDQIIDQQETRFAFREVIFKDDGFYLNGERVKLIGLNRHQLYPYIGGAAPARLQRKDADILKYELGVNIVRTSHYPQSPHFLDRCDEIGLLVFEEIPGWQFIGDNDWKALSLRDLESMIIRDRNHPSIILWGVRINESWDDDAFYTATNQLAHQLDPTRQTAGVRNFQESKFLEDVFTYNDFSNTIVEPVNTPHLVTEFSGHMYPTKTFDQEERQVEHALRHTRIQNAQMGMSNVTGAIGWCAFDYNTHVNFGSGDRICYHGVMDMFRLPKFASYLYSSQGVNQPFLRAATFWTPGDRSVGGVDPLYVYTNCDEVEVFIGDESFGRFQPDRAQFPHLTHPPVQVVGLSGGAIWGEHFRDLRLVGYQNGQPAVEQFIASDAVPNQLILTADDAQIDADGADMTRLVFRIADKYGNRLPFSFAVVSFEIDGPGELVGDTPFPLVGGQAAVYLRAGNRAGIVTVRASAPRLAPAEVQVMIG